MVSGPMPVYGGRVEIFGVAAYEAASARIVAANSRIARSVAAIPPAPIMAPVAAGRGIVGGGSGRGGASAGLFGGGGGLRGGGFIGQRIGPLSFYGRLPVQLNLIAVAAGVLGGAVVLLGSRLEKTERQIKVFGETTDAQARTITKSAIDMSRQWNIAANDIAKGAVSLGKAGAPLVDINNEILKATVLLSAVSDEELDAAEAGEFLTQVLFALNLPFSKAREIAQLTAAAVQGSTASFGDFTVQLRQSLPILGILGISFEEAAATLAVLNQGALRGQIAGTSFRNMLLALANPTSKAAEILEKYNIGLFNLDGTHRSVIDLIDSLVQAFGRQADSLDTLEDAMSFFELTDVFHSRQILAAATAANVGTEAYQNMFAVMQRAPDIEDMLRDLNKNIIDQGGILINQLKAGASVMALEFVPNMTQGLINVNESLRASEGPWESYGEAVRNALIGTESVSQIFDNLAGGLDIAREGLNDIVLAFLGADDAARRTGETLTAVSRIVGISWAITGKIFEEVGAIISDPTVPDMFLTHWLSRLEIAKQAWIDLHKIVFTILETARLYFEQSGLLHERFEENWNRLEPLAIFAGEQSAAGFASTIESALTAAMARASAVMAQDASNLFAELDVIIAGYDARVAAATTLRQQMFAIPVAPIEDLSFGGLQPVPRIPVPSGTRALIAPSGSGGGGGGGASGPSIDDLTAKIRGLLRDLPGVNNELARFLAQIGQDDASRITPMVNALLGQRDAFVELIVARRDMLAVDLQLMAVGQRISQLETESNRLSLEQARAVIGYNQQLLGLRQQVLELDNAAAPIRDRLTMVEREMSRLQQENLDLALRRVAVELQMLPLRQQLQDIERLINIENRTNFALARQKLQLDLASLELRQQLEDIDVAISLASREDLVSAEARLRLDLQLLPIHNALADIDREMSKLGRENYELTRRRLQDELAALPLKQQMRDLEWQITDLVDRRQQLIARREELLAQIGVDEIARQMREVESALSVAWDEFNVPVILDLEEQKRQLRESAKTAEEALQVLQDEQKIISQQTELAQIELQLEQVALEELLKPIERRLELIQDTVELQNLLNELVAVGLREQRAEYEALLEPLEDIRIALEREDALQRLLRDIAVNGLEREKRAIENLVRPYDDKLRAIQREEEAQRIRRDLVILSYEEEKQRIQDLMRPLQDKHDAVNREIETERLRNSEFVLHLEREKRLLQEQLIPLEDQRRAIERVMQQIDLLRSRAELEFEERKIQIQAMILDEQLRQAELERTREKMAQQFLEMILGYSDSLDASGAFTRQEGIEVLKRMGLWDDQIGKVAESIIEFQRLTDEAHKAGGAINSIPRDVTIRIKTIHETIFESSGVPPFTEGVPQFARGGKVPGPQGMAQLAIVHGGESVISARNMPHVPDSILARGMRIQGNTTVINNYNTTYDMDPHYSNSESPANIRADLDALVMLARG